MPAYSFKEQFVPMLCDDSKQHTIRSRRKKGFAKVGDTLYLYFGLRTKWCRKLGEKICTSVETIYIGPLGSVGIYSQRITDQQYDELIKWGFIIGLTERILSGPEKDLLAWKDGFRLEKSSLENPKGCFDVMLQWWKQVHPLPFVGDLIHWKQ